MTKIYPVTNEINCCVDCHWVLDWSDTGKKEYKCNKVKRIRIIKDEGEIPKWCPLPDKDVK